MTTEKFQATRICPDCGSRKLCKSKSTEDFYRKCHSCAARKRLSKDEGSMSPSEARRFLTGLNPYDKFWRPY